MRSNAGFFIHNILVCEWIKQTLNSAWPKEFCLSTPRARFDFLNDDLDSLMNNFEGKEIEIDKLKSYLALAKKAFKQSNYSKARSQLDAFIELTAKSGNNSIIDRLIYMSKSIIKEMEYYDLK